MKNNLIGEQKKLTVIMLVFLFTLTFSVNVFADGLADTTLVKGVDALFSDGTKILMGIGQTIMIFLYIYFSVRKGNADVNDQKTWAERLKTLFACNVGMYVVPSVIPAVMSYFK